MMDINYEAVLTRLETGRNEKSIAHNAATLLATFGGARIALADPIPFDPRAGFWFRPDRRVFTAFFTSKWPKFPSGPAEDALVAFALQVSRHLDDGHRLGVIPKSWTGYPSRSELGKFLRPIRAHLATIDDPPGWEHLQRKSLGADTAARALQTFVDAIQREGFEAHEGRLRANMRWFPFFDAKNVPTLERRSRFFVAFRHAVTSTNAYRMAGAQYFGPVVGNTDTMVFLRCIEAWMAGRSLTEAPLIAFGNDKEVASDRSHTNLVRELWGLLNLHRAPFFNKRAASYVDDDHDDDPLVATLAIGRATRAFLTAHPDAVKRAAACFVRALRTAQRDREGPFAFARRIPEPGDTTSFDARLLQEIRDVGERHLLGLSPLDQACMALHLQVDADISGFPPGPPQPPPAPQPAGQRSLPGGLRGARRVWIYSPGEQASEWATDQKDGVASIGWDELDDLTTYESVEDIVTALQEDKSRTQVPIVQGRVCWQFAHDVGVGDAIVARRGRGTVIGVGVVTGPYEHRAERVRYRHVVPVRWLASGEHALADRTTLAMVTIVDSARRTSLINELDELYRTELGEPRGSENPPDPGDYTLTDALKDLFIEQPRLEQMLQVLRRKKNIVLQGPPGVGKTFVADRLAWLLMGAKDVTRREFVQFHPSYTYEQFVRGYRPAAGGGFVVENGPLYQLADRARGNPGQEHVLIVDEINRAHLGRVLGEAMMLLEPDKRSEDWAVRLAAGDGKGSDERFHLPPNLYVIGTMNTADRSLAVVDYALRRRFAFLTLTPSFHNARFRAQFDEIPARHIDGLVEKLERLNQTIRNDPTLGPGFQIGHSFFSSTDDIPPWLADPQAWIDDVMRHEVSPLLEEYWYDAPEALQSARRLLGIDP